MSFADAFPGFKLRLTGWGAAYIAGCVVLGFAAVNTGNNALMSMLAMALGSYIVSGTWSRQVLASVDVAVSLPAELYAGRSTFAEIRLSNRSRALGRCYSRAGADNFDACTHTSRRNVLVVHSQIGGGGGRQ